MNPGEQNTFLSKFTGTATIKDRALAVIVEYVPLSHSPDALTEMRKIERDYIGEQRDKNPSMSSPSSPPPKLRTRASETH
jgi:hypothetical protein